MHSYGNKTSVMNNTKWEELRLGMYGLKEFTPSWRTRDIVTGHICEWDREWFYHFSEGGYETIEWVEIKTEDALQKQVVLKVLKLNHIPAEVSEFGYKIYGYADDTASIQYVE
jgi:hypothetical protein